MLFATHDRDIIQRVGRRVLTLDAGRLAGDETLAGSARPEPGPPPVEGEEAPPQAEPTEPQAEEAAPA